MPKIDSETLDEVARKWREMRFKWQSKKYTPGKNEIAGFIRDTNGLSEQLISALGNSDPDYLVALSECAGNAAAMIVQREAAVKASGETSST